MCKKIFLLISLLSTLKGIEYQRIILPGTTVTVNDTIWVSTTIQNNSGDTLKGLVYSEQILSGIRVIPYSLKINDVNYSSYTVDIGNSGDVYTGEIPYRWIVQTPPDFTSAGSIVPAGTIEILYGLSSTTNISFSFNQDAWYGGLTGADTLTPVFGYDSLNTITLSFIGGSSIEHPESRSLTFDLFQLFQNYPNPFNAETEISFSIPVKSLVILDLLDLQGRVLTTLFSDHGSPGLHKIRFNAAQFASGVYFYRLRSGQFQSVKKLILLR